MSSDEQTYDLSPDKRTLRSLRSDVTPITAVEELVDNVLDNWRRIDAPKNDITIDVDIDFENDVFRIEDDSGGLSEQNVKKIFALGGSTKEEIPNSIGAYGMGAKKAILRLGNRAVIKSRAVNAEAGFGFVIDEEWLRSDTWKVTKRRFDDIDEGTTVIRVEGLNIELRDETEAEEESDSHFDTPEEYLESLREDLSKTYDEFLTGRAGPDDGEVSITVNGKHVKEQPPIDWSYTPFDGFHPRLYKQYEISPEELPSRNEPVMVDIIAGLMRGGETEKAGTDVIIQNRRILTSNKGEMGGWGTHLPSFRPNLRRTRFIVKITAESNPETLPWDTQKDRIEPNSVITDRVFNVLRRAAKDYTKVTYENFPIQYSKPFTQDAVSGKQDVAYDSIQRFGYSERKQFIAKHKPDSTLPEKGRIGDLVDYHREELEIFAPHIVANPFVQAYRASFDPSNQADKDYSPDSDEVWIVPEAAKRFPEQELHLFLETVKSTAERHRQKGVTIAFGEESPWWQSYYERIQRKDDTKIDELDSTEDVERIRERIQIKGEEQDLPESILSDSLRASGLEWMFSEGPEAIGKESSTQMELQQINEGDNQLKKDEEINATASETDSNEQPTTDLNEKAESADRDVEDTDDEDDSESSDEEENTTPNFGTSTERGSVQSRLSNQQSILLQVRQSTYEEICLEVGLNPDESTAREVGQAVLDEGVEIQSFVNGSGSSER